MDQGTCTAEDCERPQKSRGLCGPHYHLWRTSRLVCSIEDCGKPGFARGWCTGHYSKWQRHGDPLAQSRQSPRSPADYDKPKRCSRCGETKPADQFGRNQARPDGRAAYCFGCNSASVKAHNEAHPDKRRLLRREYRQRYRANLEFTRRLVTPRDLKRLVARYRGLCAYCPNPWKQFDHVIPLTRGGRHAIGNLLPACVRCNTSKNDRTIMEWRLLLGGPRRGRPRAT
jgi:5-methylcytosine-specific restriction endonuclease McrA